MGKIVSILGSNDCGIFATHFCERIYQDSANFEVLAKRRTLANWFAQQSLNGRREELAQHIRLLCEDQRKADQPLEGKPNIRLPSPADVGQQVRFVTRYIVTNCLQFLNSAEKRKERSIKRSHEKEALPNSGLFMGRHPSLSFSVYCTMY